MGEPHKAPEYYGRPRRELQRFVPDGARRILDVGCGAGAFAAGLLEARPGLEITGIEFDPEAARKAAQVLHAVHTGDAFAVIPTLPRGVFDCICLNDVLEHLLEPGDLLAMLPPLLAPGGRVTASIPSVRYFWNVVDLVLKGRWDYADEGICDRTHLRFFTRSSMMALFRDGGFAVETVEGINPTGSLKFKIFNALTLGRFAEMKYLQFVLAGRPAGMGDEK
ncbi:MAG: methyltransferase domain-containing protein [Candidatus Krumholzibacteriia bacterium]